jgi:CubicO group peptidase (beta-lactamase class C family)
MKSPALVLPLLLLIGSITATSIAADDATSAASAQIDSLMGAWVDADGPGAAVAVLLDGEVIHLAGYGLANLEHNIPITPQTVFNAGSIAKQFTAFAIAILAQEGALALGDDIRDQLPKMPDHGAAITVRHLVDHTSGLRDTYDLMALAGLRHDDVITKEQVLRLIYRQQEANFPPGEQWLYCNSGYTLLAEIVAKVTGQSFAGWMRENIFRPLGMENTRFPETHQELYPGRADSYDWSEEGYRIAKLNSSDLGCTALWTTAEDLIKWVLNLEDFRVGGAEVGQIIAERGFLNSGAQTDYAFGHFCRQHRGLQAISHSGKTAAYLSYVVRYPEEHLAVIFLGNASYLRPAMLAEEIAGFYLDPLLAQETAGKGERGDVTPPEPSRPSSESIDLDSATLERYEGDYQLSSSGKLLQVTMEIHHLLLHNLSVDPFRMVPISAKRFLLEGSTLEVSFQCDGTTPADALILHIGRHSQGAARVKILRLTRAERAEFAGDYYSAELGTVYSVIEHDEKLLATHARHPDTELIALGSDHFQGSQRWLRNVDFGRGDRGEITGFGVSTLGCKGLWFEKITRQYR